jgi:hypothetical protein
MLAREFGNVATQPYVLQDEVQKRAMAEAFGKTLLETQPSPAAEISGGTLLNDYVAFRVGVPVDVPGATVAAWLDGLRTKQGGNWTNLQWSYDRASDRYRLKLAYRRKRLRTEVDRCAEVGYGALILGIMLACIYILQLVAPDRWGRFLLFH